MPTVSENPTTGNIPCRNYNDLTAAVVREMSEVRHDHDTSVMRTVSTARAIKKLRASVIKKVVSAAPRDLN